MKDKVGFIGLGMMGSLMAKRLIDNGQKLVVWNRSYEKLKQFEGIADIARSPKDLFSRCHITVFMLTHGNAIREVIIEKNGIAGMEEGDIIIDMGTVGPSFSQDMAQFLKNDGIYYYDAPVLGSIGPAATGQLQIFLGGDPKKVGRIMPILNILGREVNYIGQSGAGSALKLVANMMLTRMVDALGDALAFGKKMGLEYEQVMGLLENSVLASPMWKRGYMLTKQDPPLHFTLKNVLKDLNLILLEAQNHNISLPVAAILRENFVTAKLKKGPDYDYSGIVKVKIES